MTTDPEFGHVFKQYVILDTILAVYLLIVIIHLFLTRIKDYTHLQLVKKYIFYPHITIFMIWISLVSVVEMASMGSVASLVITAFTLASLFYLNGKFLAILHALCFSLVIALTYYYDLDSDSMLEKNSVLASLLLFSLIVSRFMFNQKLDQFLAITENNKTNKKLIEEIETRKIAEKQLRGLTNDLEQSLEKEKELNQLKSRFITLVSHEFRTPLTVIQTSNSLQEIAFNRGIKEKFDKHNKNINSSIKNLTDMVEDVLFFDRKQSKKLEVRSMHFDLAAVVHETVDKIKISTRSSHKFNVQLSDNEIKIDNDPDLIQRIIFNILANSTKYSPGESNINVAVLNNSQNVRIQITDYGIGIDKLDIPTITEPFTRGSNASNYSGVGLGLSIVKNCLDMIHGSFDIESEPNQGTSVSILIPKSLSA
jgi:signal transduction histidine kinase